MNVKREVIGFVVMAPIGYGLIRAVGLHPGFEFIPACALGWLIGIALQRYFRRDRVV